MIFILICSFLIGTFKAISDSVSHKDLWDKTIFSKYKEDGFFGHKDKSWIRKHKYKNKILLWLFKNPLVMFTDLWHLSNSLKMLMFWLSIFNYIYFRYLGLDLYYILLFSIPLYSLGFNLFYSVFLIKK